MYNYAEVFWGILLMLCRAGYHLTSLGYLSSITEALSMMSLGDGI
jgi:hypothetical protein